MKLAQIAFAYRRAFKSLREFFWTHILTSGTMAVTLFIFGGFLLLQENLHGLLKGWGSQVQLFAYLNDSPSATEVDHLLDLIRSYPEVESVRFVSKEEAWENFKEALGTQSGILEGLEAEILPASLEIALKKPHRQRSSLESVAQRVRAAGRVSEVEYPDEWMEKLNLVILGVQWAKWVVGGFLFVATLLIVGSTAKLAILARRDEIEIMKLVGAPQGLIKAPFVIEGMIQGIAGASLSLGFLWLLFLFLSLRVTFPFGVLWTRGSLQFLDPAQICFLVFLGWALGALGSLFSLRRFVRTWGR